MFVIEGKCWKVLIDDFDKCVIRNIVQDFYVHQSVVPTVKKLLPIVKTKIRFPWREKTLARILKSMGFKWRKCQSKRKIGHS